MLIPLAGYAVANTRGHGPSFWGVTAPSFFSQDRALSRSVKSIHEFLAWTLVALVAIHAAAALWHQFVQRDGVLRRMLPGGARGPER